MYRPYRNLFLHVSHKKNKNFGSQENRYKKKNRAHIQENSYNNNDGDDGVILEDKETGGRMDISGILEISSKRLMTLKQLLIYKVQNGK